MPLVVAAIAGSPAMARAHGAKLDHQTVQAIEAIARYDSGEPMAGASVTVYPPDDPQTPWSTGTTDGAGRFWFRPDRPGTWELKVRQAGHGSLIAIAVDPAIVAPSSSATPATPTSATPTLGATLRPPNGTLSPVSRWITIAAVTWGCIGTALFFSRRRPAP
ncbi:MAG: carboxypeptidase regulatory-like domain-containing protein [Cyanophyceae cyanobacterium]